MISEQITQGVERAPQRSLLYAAGFTEDEIKKPLIGVVSAQSEIIPGHMHLSKIAEAVKAGIYAAGGTPVVVPAIGVCDGIVMGHRGMHYSLASRELIADSVETLAAAHCFDGLVLIPNCDKIVPGMVMAALRLNIPAIVCSGGPMLAGRVKGKKTSLSQMFEAVGAYKAGKLDDAGLLECEKGSCPSCGSCSGMFTANSMNCLCEALGLALHGNGTIPAPYSERLRFAKESGKQIMELVRRDIKPRDIVNEQALENAITVDMALGCSTNSSLHLPAIAHEAGYKLDTANLPDLFKQARPTVICDRIFARELSAAFQVPEACIHPIVPGLTYHFDDFTLNTFSGNHTDLGTVSNFDGGKMFADPENPMIGPLNSYGCLYNTNYAFTLKNGFFIGFAAGVDLTDLQAAWKNRRPGLLLRQRIATASAESYAEECASLGAQLVLPMHQDASCAENSDMNLFAQKVNGRFVQKNCTARMFNPQRLKWYSLESRICLDEN